MPSNAQRETSIILNELSAALKKALAEPTNASHIEPLYRLADELSNHPEINTTLIQNYLPKLIELIFSTSENNHPYLVGFILNILLSSSCIELTRNLLISSEIAIEKLFALKHLAENTEKAKNLLSSSLETRLNDIAKNKSEHHTLLRLLFTAVSKNKNTDNDVTAIAKIIQSLEESTNPISLAVLLFKKTETDDNKNGWYYLTTSLAESLKQNKNIEISTGSIYPLIKLCITTCDSGPISAGLAEKATAGDDAGKNAWYFLTLALDRAVAHKNDAAITSISTLIQQCITKCDDPTAISAGLDGKATAGNNAGKNAWYWLACAL